MAGVLIDSGIAQHVERSGFRLDFSDSRRWSDLGGCPENGTASGTDQLVLGPVGGLARKGWSLESRKSHLVAGISNRVEDPGNQFLGRSFLPREGSDRMGRMCGGQNF